MPSMVGGRLTRFCFPLMKIVMYSFRRRFFSAFSAAVSFRFRFVMLDTAPFLSLSGFEWLHFSLIFQYLIPGAPSWHSGQRLSNISDRFAP
jgi:hypothetical protein